ncbi:MAG: hypothetical protein AAFO93_08525 [Pseudomonadota bacterium]
MNERQHQQEIRRKRRARRALREARRHLADPQSKLGRLLSAYDELKSSGRTTWVLPEA